MLTAGGLYLARGLGPAPPPASGQVTALQTPATCDAAAAGSCAGRPFHAAFANVPPAASANLSSSFTHIGIAIYLDGSGAVWLTQNFSD